ncbi:hypothetical protein [Sphaerochaeta sp. PS]|uniref:hypothetical protein n=1 Tax=Sphaerochaeta sp. PS TaxID=3076336 RepID=UPI0028A55C41|nr:hypothetical protein [Sphaerochaeta sp. PS]MDT4761552.1 hypothetical protein [Sphaerochaeta sp. PS]
MNNTHLFSSQPTRGIIRIWNLQTETSLVVKSEDLTQDIQAIRFSLDLGNFPNQPLQSEYEKQGLEIFSIEALILAEQGENLDKLLASSKQALLDMGVSFYAD